MMYDVIFENVYAKNSWNRDVFKT